MSKIKTNLLMLALAALVVIVPQSSFALSSVSTSVCGIFNCIVNSNFLVVIATVAIFFLGIGAFFGKVNWGLVIIIALGIVIIVGAMSIATKLVGANSCAQQSFSGC